MHKSSEQQSWWCLHFASRMATEWVVGWSARWQANRALHMCWAPHVPSHVPTPPSQDHHIHATDVPMSKLKVSEIFSFKFTNQYNCKRQKFVFLIPLLIKISILIPFQNRIQPQYVDEEVGPCNWQQRWHFDSRHRLQTGGKY